MIASVLHGSAFVCRKMIEAYEREHAEKLLDTEVNQMVLFFSILADYCFLELNGHTHIPAHQNLGACIYMNPGFIAIPKENSERGYIVYDKTFQWKIRTELA